ncbi:MAG: hypothetical protein BWY76_00797 [bacterium ADurb.Bin429]|nr:MAG: hypothetical protein BWY76_00797 [bacterium ADurb.Bin429]
MATTTSQHPLPTTPPRRRIRCLTDEDAAVLAIIRARLDDEPVRTADLYDLALRMLDGRVAR